LAIRRWDLPALGLPSAGDFSKEPRVAPRPPPHRFGQIASIIILAE
jgi:hypothetical protein